MFYYQKKKSNNSQGKEHSETQEEMGFDTLQNSHNPDTFSTLSDKEIEIGQVKDGAYGPIRVFKSKDVRETIKAIKEKSKSIVLCSECSLSYLDDIWCYNCRKCVDTIQKDFVAVEDIDKHVGDKLK